MYTDHLKHDVGTGSKPAELKGPDFDTPSLRGIYATAPYLHDGRAATLMEVLTAQNTGDVHGMTSGLTELQLNDLIAFMKSITNEPPIFSSSFE